MPHQLSPKDLINNEKYKLLKKVKYSSMKTFILDEARYKSREIKIYGLIQLIAAIALLVVLGYFVATSVHSKTVLPELWSIFVAILSSFTIIIPIHEGIHALAFLILGKRDISFGVQWKKFIFYAESNMQVLDRKQIQFVALLPMLIITLACLISILTFTELSQKLFFGITLLIHLFFCSGDVTIVSFFNRHKPSEVYTFDSRKEKQTYYYIKEKN